MDVNVIISSPSDKVDKKLQSRWTETILSANGSQFFMKQLVY